MQELFDAYVSNSAPSQVNLPSTIVREMKASISTLEGAQIKVFFDEACDHVMKLMQRDSYRRFQATTEFVAIAANIADVEPDSNDHATIASEASSSTGLTPQTPHTLLVFSSNRESNDSSCLPEPIARKKKESPMEQEMKEIVSERLSTTEESRQLAMEGTSLHPKEPVSTSTEISSRAEDASRSKLTVEDTEGAMNHEVSITTHTHEEPTVAIAIDPVFPAQDVYSEKRDSLKTGYQLLE